MEVPEKKGGGWIPAKKVTAVEGIAKCRVPALPLELHALVGEEGADAGRDEEEVY